jgi:signal peptidase
MQKVKKAWSVVSTVLVVLIVLCAVFLMGTRLIGYRVYSVISGSMEPELSVGDLLYVRPVDPAKIEVGDDISFVLNEDLVVATHRVVRIDAEKQHIYTKGIANEIEDSEPVHFKNVIGVVDFSLPLLGYVSDYIQSSPGMYITIAAVSVLIVLVFLPDFLPKKKEEKVAVPSAEELAAQDENARLKEELEALKAQLQKETPPQE